MRQALILQVAEIFRPDVLIVDKEPTGFRGEVLPALEHLRSDGCRLVLGIRDVMDEPALLVPEWERKGAKEALSRYYDEIWVYGLKDVYQPLAALALAARDRAAHHLYRLSAPGGAAGSPGRRATRRSPGSPSSSSPPAAAATATT